MRLLNGELVKDEDRYKCKAVKSNLSKFIVETHFTTKKHLDNVYGINEDLQSSFTDSNKTTGDCMICTSICKNLKKNIINRLNMKKMLKKETGRWKVASEDYWVRIRS